MCIESTDAFVIKGPSDPTTTTSTSTTFERERLGS